ncbi:MAG: hypothetical protein KAJ03_05155 [Gammaproteobacteria bacterium]|nr:hypothetical protein [Gammaproteobacteria bacterium]
MVKKIIMYADYLLNIFIATFGFTFVIFYPIGWTLAELQREQYGVTSIFSPTDEYLHAAGIDVVLISLMCLIAMRMSLLCCERICNITNTLKGVE